MNNIVDACWLAQVIASDTRFQVIAIGRFVTTAELNASGADALPWGVSVMWRHHPELMGRVWNEKEFVEFARMTEQEASKPKNAPSPPRPSTRKPPDEQGPRRDTKHLQQPSLF